MTSFFICDINLLLFSCLVFTVVPYLGIMKENVLNLQHYIWNSVFSATNVLLLFLVLLTQYCAGGKIENNEMGGACGAYGGGESCA